MSNAESARFGLGIAIAGTGLVLLVRAMAEPLLGGDGPLRLFLLPVFAASYLGGLAPGVFAIGLAAAASEFLMNRPTADAPPEAAAHFNLLLFCLEGLAFAGLAQLLRRAREAPRRLLGEMDRERARLATVLEQLPAGVVIAEAGGDRRMQGNRKLGEIFRRPLPHSRNVAEYADWTLFHPGDGRPYDPAARPLARSLRGETVSGEEIGIVRGDGSTGLISASSAPIREGDGRIAGAVVVIDDVTERRSLERELLEGARRYARLVENSPDVIYTVSAPDGVVTELNAAFERITGLPREECLGRRLDELIHPDDRPLAWETFRRAAAGEAMPPYELRIRARDGGWLIGEFHSGPRIEHGRVVGEMGIVRDVTQRKRAEDRFRLAIEAAPNAIVLVNAQGDIVLVNTQTERLFGYLRSEMIGRSVELLVPERYRGRHPGYRSGFFANPDARPMGAGRELFGRRKDGSEFPVEIGLNPITADDGVMVLSAIVDITARKRAEERLRESEERYRLLVESAADHAMLMTDPDGRIDGWNTGAERLFGWTEKEILGRPVSVIFVPEDAAAGVAGQELRKAEAEGRAEDRRWHLRKDGSRFWANGVVTPIRDGRGVTRGFAKVMRDDTDRKRAEEERQRLLDQAEAANRAKDEFLATLSHELRNPLNTIVGWVSLLQSGGLSDAEAAAGLDIIRRSSQIQVQLIRDLLDVSRIVTGKLHLEPRPTDLAAVIRSALDGVRFAADAKCVRLEADFAVPVFPTVGDPDRLRQAVWNLLSNAVKFTPSGGRVRVELAREGRQVRIRVTDTGKGIAPGFLPHAFERFRQGDGPGSRAHGGLGLGLSIVRHIVEHHGGAVTAESAGEGMGAVFTILLPVHAVVTAAPSAPVPAAADVSAGDSFADGPAPADTAPAAPPGPAEPAEPAAPPDLRGVRVLVVEDEPDGRSMIVNLLKRCGAEVSAAGSAAEAMDLIGRSRPDVLLSDIGMPDEDGYSLIRRVRRLPAEQGGRVPAAALTAFAADRDRREALSAGFQLHVAKPVDPYTLQSAVARLAGRA